jgi:hypothetical protein
MFRRQPAARITTLPNAAGGRMATLPDVCRICVGSWKTGAYGRKRICGSGVVCSEGNMELAMPWPLSQGEWFAWSSAAVTILFGVLFLFAPRLTLRVLRLQTEPRHPEAVSEARATMAGFYLGVGLCGILLAQPLLYLTLGVCWLLTAFGRIISMLSDRGNTPFNWISLLVELTLGGLPLAFVLGLVQ